MKLFILAIALGLSNLAMAANLEDGLYLTPPDKNCAMQIAAGDAGILASMVSLPNQKCVIDGSVTYNKVSDSVFQANATSIIVDADLVKVCSASTCPPELYTNGQLIIQVGDIWTTNATLQILGPAAFKIIQDTVITRSGQTIKTTTQDGSYTKFTN